MGFFKDFKEDLSQAVNELSDDASKLVGAEVVDDKLPSDDVMVDTLADSSITAGMMDEVSDNEIEASLSKALADIDAADDIKSESNDTEIEKAVDEPAEAVQEDDEDAVSDETAIITPGLVINGDVTSAGSIELLGKVEGNVTCKGKLIVSGTIKGNSSSSDFFADKANITGNVKCDGPAKIGSGSVIVGNLVATSAVIAGAIKGDIDVQGPVIIDTTAIVMGDIKSKLVQINNGAVIEGHCSQCYSDNSPKKFFGEN